MTGNAPLIIAGGFSNRPFAHQFRHHTLLPVPKSDYRLGTARITVQRPLVTGEKETADGG